MKYLSICSGIEAASVAFEPLGWRPLAFSEIEAFPRAVLKHHYPDTPCHGDFTTLKDEPWIVDADMLCGGTPCQAFSVAGNRQSLADDRGNLTLQFVLLADAIDHLRSTAGRDAAWILWENVPGVLSTHDNAFGAFLGGLCGRDAAIPEPEGGWTDAGVVDGPTRCAAWRILDAQHFGLAQRRKRVFVLAKGGAGKWAAADALLPLIESSKWHPAPSRSKGKGTTQGADDGIAEVVGTITTNTGPNGHDAGNFQSNQGVDAGHLIPITMASGQANAEVVMDGSPSITCLHEVPIAFVQNQREEVREQDVAGALNAEQGSHQTTYVFDPAQITSKTNRSNPQPGEACHTLHQGDAPLLVRMREGKEGGGKGPLVSEDQSLTLATGNDQVLCAPTLTASNDPSRSPQSSEVTAQIFAVMQATGNDQVLAFQPRHYADRERMGGEPSPLCHTLSSSSAQGDSSPHVTTDMQVRRLTPVETSRLQGFPDTYCHIPTKKWRKIPADEAAYLQRHGLHAELRGEQWYTSVAADGPIYKANGNSWAVPVVRWIGERIELVNETQQQRA